MSRTALPRRSFLLLTRSGFSTKAYDLMARHRRPKASVASKKPPLTHFLCVPLVTPTSRQQLESSIQSFRDLVAPSNEQGSSGHRIDGARRETLDEKAVAHIHPKSVRPIGTLHCTLGVMSLNESSLSEAIQFLKTLDVISLLRDASTLKYASDPSSLIEKPGDGNSVKDQLGASGALEHNAAPIQVDLKGLTSMHAPQNTSILYCAPTDLSGRLYPFCQALQTLFKEKEFILPDDRPLKLHATIVNTIYAKGRKPRPHPNSRPQNAPSGSSISTAVEQGLIGDTRGNSEGHGPNANAPLKIDARAILDKFQDFVWAEGVVLDRIALCEMGAKKVSDASGNVIAEEYHEVSSIALPS